MKIVILGGSGFLGSSLTRHLCKQQCDVVTVSRSPMPTMGKRHRHLDITLDDRRALQPALDGADFLFHLASDSTPGSTRLQPVLEGMNNIMPTLQLLELLQGCSQPTLVYISSGGAVYDPASPAPYDELAPTRPLSYYGAGKLAAEAFIAAANGQTGQAAVILRPSNVYGPGQLPKKQFGIVPTLLGALRDDTPFTIWGDGSAVRDYLYIDDFIALCEAITNHSWEQDCLQHFNAGSGQGFSISQLCKAVESVSGRSLRLEREEARGVDTPAVVLDSSRALHELGWQAQTPLVKGLEKTWQWLNH